MQRQRAAEGGRTTMKLHELGQYIFFGSIDKTIYEEEKSVTGRSNLRAVKRLSLVSMLLFFLAGLFFLAETGLDIRFVTCMFFSGCVGIVAYRAVGIPYSRAKYCLPLVYVYSAIMMIATILLDGVIGKHYSCVTFTACTVIFMMIFTDLPWHMFILSGTAEILMIITSALSKSTKLFEYDLLCIIIFTITNFFLCPYMMQIKFADILTRRRIEHERDIDSLTQLYHKDVVRHTVNETLSLSAFHDCALMFLDVDNFKHFNDTYGHAAGDAILKYIASSIKEGCPDIATIGRYGGDEFIAFLPEVDDIYQLQKTAQGILDLVDDRERCLRITDVPECPSLSIGIAVYPSAGRSYNELVKAADKVLYQVKNNGKNNYGIYDTNGTNYMKRTHLGE